MKMAQLLKKSPSEINLRILREFPEYLEARDRNQISQTGGASAATDEQESKTPAERLEEAYEMLRKNSADELLSQLKSSNLRVSSRKSWSRFW